jgi:O-antigen ligase
MSLNAVEGRTGRPWRRIRVIYAACLFCLVAVGGQAWREVKVERQGIEPPVPGAEHRPGVNVELSQYRADELDQVLSDVASLGFHWVRQRFPWQAIEPQPGIYRWEPWDLLVDAVRRQGLELIAVLESPPSWACEARDPDRGGVLPPMPCRPPCDAGAYARFVSAFAARYGETIDVYQVWDEPNLSRSWGGGHVAPCGYSVLLEAAYPALHAADPTARVLGGGLAPTQAAGPDDLNDLEYLLQLYATGGGAYFDILAVKAYGFWSGPEDRRVAPDVLNFSRAVAVRALMRANGDRDKAAWAVEWGWNALPQDWDGEPPPWGSDLPAVQGPRIVAAVQRARGEWPWMGVLCWAAYQPDAAPGDPRWGFALRGPAGAPTALYDVLQAANETPAPAAKMPLRWWLLGGLWLAGCLDAVLLWRACECGAWLLQLWRRWKNLRPAYQAGIGVLLVALYALTPWPEWIAVELALGALAISAFPGWSLLAAVFCIPFFHAFKTVGRVWIAPAEPFLLFALLAAGVRVVKGQCWRGFGRAVKRANALDVLWLLWTLWGAAAASIAPDATLAWREWRLCMLDPALLYLVLRLQYTLVPGQERGWGGGLRRILLAWIASGVVVALIALGQWGVGELIPAGVVRRVTSVYYSPNHLALYLERVWPLALALALSRALDRRWRLLAWAAVAAMGTALYLTYSRGAWLLAIPAALLVVVGGSWKRVRWRGGLVLGVLALFLAGVLGGRMTSFSALFEEVRIPVWRSTLDMIADHPWLGVGLDGFRTVYPRYMRVEAWTEPLLYHPHNMWLDAAVRLGLPGLALFAALFGRCMAPFCRVKVRATAFRASGISAHPYSGLYEAVSTGLLAGLAAAVAHGCVDSGYFLVDLAWSLALVAGAAAAMGADVAKGM